LNCELLRHEKNRGPGYAFATAFEYLAPLITDKDWVVTMEGDNTSNPDSVLRMLVRRKEGYDLVLASVYNYGGGFIDVKWSRLAISYLANEIVKFALRIYGLNTLSSFFRLYSGNLIRTLQNKYGKRIVELAGFGWAVEMLFKCIQTNASISEIETTVDWTRRQGKSKMKLLRTGIEYLKIILIHSRWK
jgi:dolichol-phosphate mannosyltransferase